MDLSRVIAILIACAIVLCVPSGRAHASAPDAARSAYLNAAFDAAEKGFRRVLKSKRASRAERAEAHRYLSALEFLDGHRAAAYHHVRHAIALEPTIAPPEGAPPAITRYFRKVKASRAPKPPVALTTEHNAVAVLVTATVQAAPSRRARWVHIRCKTRAGERGSVARLPEVAVLLPRDTDAIQCTTEVLTQSHAVLTTRTETIKPLAAHAALQP